MKIALTADQRRNYAGLVELYGPDEVDRFARLFGGTAMADALAADYQNTVKLFRRYTHYAAKWFADTLFLEPPRPLEPTDENLTAILCTPTIARKARPEEFDAIRDAIERLSRHPQVQKSLAEAEAAGK